MSDGNTRGIIGIIGGMGPEAGFDLARKITAMTVAKLDQDHHSVVVVSSPSKIPDRTAFLTGRTDVNPAGPIISELVRLEACGATVAAIACNTAHAPRIMEPILAAIEQRGLRIRLLHLVEETVRSLAELPGTVRLVGILGTRATIQFGLYESALTAAGYESLVPDIGHLESRTWPAIYDSDRGIKARSSPVTEWARERVQDGIHHLLGRGADAVILGCTELPLALSGEDAPRDVPVIDPAVIMARRLIAAVDVRPEAR